LFSPPPRTRKLVFYPPLKQCELEMPINTFQNHFEILYVKFDLDPMCNVGCRVISLAHMPEKLLYLLISETTKQYAYGQLCTDPVLVTCCNWHVINK